MRQLIDMLESEQETTTEPKVARMVMEWIDENQSKLVTNEPDLMVKRLSWEMGDAISGQVVLTKASDADAVAVWVTSMQVQAKGQFEASSFGFEWGVASDASAKRVFYRALMKARTFIGDAPPKVETQGFEKKIKGITYYVQMPLSVSEATKFLKMLDKHLVEE